MRVIHSSRALLSPFASRVGVATIAIAFLLLPTLLAAQSPYSGTYQLGTATEQAETVSFSLAVRIANNTSADVTNAYLVLADPATHKVYGSVPAVSVAAKQDVVVSGTFNAPTQDYQRWVENGFVCLGLAANPDDAAVDWIEVYPLADGQTL